jgi:hypothetical protein
VGRQWGRVWVLVKGESWTWAARWVLIERGIHLLLVSWWYWFECAELKLICLLWFLPAKLAVNSQDAIDRLFDA